MVPAEGFEPSAYRLQGDCSTTELYGRYLVPLTGIDPVSQLYQSCVLPLYYRGIVGADRGT